MLSLRGWVTAITSVVVMCAIGVLATFIPTQTLAAGWGHRDEASFLAHVKEYYGSDVPPEAQSVPDSVFVVEGDRACQWLSEQPVVLAGNPDQGSYETFRRFLREVAPPTDWPFDNTPEGIRGSVVYDAWHYLCPDLRQRHIWSAPPGHD